jgi:hypothetical protein
VLYGSTEPGAKVTIGDQTIPVRPDGTFSFRFALPDGSFPLPLSAHSADGKESLAGHVELARATNLGRQVGVHPQDPNLNPPLPEHCR